MVINQMVSALIDLVARTPVQAVTAEQLAVLCHPQVSAQPVAPRTASRCSEGFLAVPSCLGHRLVSAVQMVKKSFRRPVVHTYRILLVVMLVGLPVGELSIVLVKKGIDHRLSSPLLLGLSSPLRLGLSSPLRLGLSQFF